MNNTKLSESEFIAACAELYMHLYNWELDGFVDCDRSKFVTTPPSVEKTRAKLDKDFLPTKYYNPYTQFFTQEQLDSTGVSWIPYACYLANEYNFTQVIAAGSWSSDPFHECGDLDIKKICQDFSDPIGQFILGIKISIINPTYKLPYDTINCEFENFITSIELATQVYKLMTHLDEYNQASSYADIYGQDFMNELDTKLKFTNYREERDKEKAQRLKEEEEYKEQEAREKAKLEEERTKKEVERKAAGNLSLLEISDEVSQITKELQQIKDETFKLKIVFAECKVQIYEEGFEKGLSKEEIKPLLDALKKKLNEEFLKLKTKSDALNAKYTEITSMQRNL